MTIAIVGAGLAGLLAASVFQRAAVFEAGSREQMTHKAVLRFRSRAVGDAVGVDFKPVAVHKGLWHNNEFVAPNIALANQYSQKVIGKIGDRSIWNLETAQRWIAPESLLEQLADRSEGRVRWDTAVGEGFFSEAREHETTIISTIPMSVLAKFLKTPATPEFQYAPIKVRRWRIRNCNVYQTIYYPTRWSPLYRASITGSLLIAESMDWPGADDTDIIEATLQDSFGLSCLAEQRIDETKQRYGKIAPIDDVWRRRFIYNATATNNIYSLGRFATWRNVLLDDVLSDVAVIKRLLAADPYERARAL